MAPYQLKQPHRPAVVPTTPILPRGASAQCRRPPRAFHLLLAAGAFTLIAIYGSLVPLHYEPLALSEAVSRFRQIPFLHLSVGSRADWVANILLFVPMGFFWLGSFSLDRGRQLACILAPLVIITGAALSIALEFTQLWFPTRTVSQNDIIAEAIGATAGAMIWIAIGPIVITWLRSYAADLRSGRRIDWFLQLYAAGFFMYALMPLDLTISLAEIYDKVQEGRVLLVPFTYSYESKFDLAYGLLTDVLVFMPVGAWIATAFTPHYQPVRSLSNCLILSLLAAVIVEACQLLVYSRYVDTTDLITSTLGGLLGAVLTHGFAHRSATVQKSRCRCAWGAALGWSAAALAYAGLLLVLFWNPFDFLWDAQQAKARWEEFFRAPFAALYWGTEFNAMRQILRKLLLFAPLGVAFAQIARLLVSQPAPRLVLLSVFLVMSFCWAMLIEIGQLLLPSHVPDLTDALLCTAGAAIGIWLTRALLPRRLDEHAVLSAAPE